MLSTIATVLLRACRNEDVVARFGGEEFVIILRAIGSDAAATTAERLRKRVEATVIPFDGRELRATLSIGLATYPATQVKTPEQLIEAAAVADR